MKNIHKINPIIDPKHMQTAENILRYFVANSALFDFLFFHSVFNTVMLRMKVQNPKPMSVIQYDGGTITEDIVL